MDFKLACEYRDVAFRPVHLRAAAKTQNEVEYIIRMLEAVAEPVMIHTKYRPLSLDEDDDMVLDLAINGAAQVIITNNLRDFEPAAERHGIAAFTAKDFLTKYSFGE